MPSCYSNTTAYEATAETMTADETQLQGGGPGSTFVQPCSSLSSSLSTSQNGGKRRRQTRRRQLKKRKTKRAGSGFFDNVYDSIFGKQEKPPPKPKKSSKSSSEKSVSSDSFDFLDVDPETAPSSMGPGYKGATGVPMEDYTDPSDYNAPDLQILGLSSDPTALKQIKDAYRKKAVRGKYKHPDKGGSKKEFQKLQSANERVLQIFHMKHPQASKKKRTKKQKRKPKKSTKKRR